MTSVNETVNTAEIENSPRLEFLVALYTDTEKLSRRMATFPSILTGKMPDLSSEIVGLLNGK